MTTRVPSLIAAVALLLGGIAEADNSGLSAALFAAGFIVLGAWLALEIQAQKRRRRTSDGSA